jgi:BMFP domain-containing protein YqiC
MIKMRTTKKDLQKSFKTTLTQDFDKIELASKECYETLASVFRERMYQQILFNNKIEIFYPTIKHFF